MSRTVHHFRANPAEWQQLRALGIRLGCRSTSHLIRVLVVSRQPTLGQRGRFIGAARCPLRVHLRVRFHE